MTKYLRYALATFCFAASVGCLALWWASFSVDDRFIIPQYFSPERLLLVECCKGFVVITSANQESPPVLTIQSIPHYSNMRFAALESRVAKDGQFCVVGRTVYFPLWYPALVVASIGVGVLRISKRFTIRSTILTTSVAALWLGIPFVF